MKKALLKIVRLSIVLLASVQFLFGQGVEENAEVRNYLNNMFSTLDKTKVPNGLLRDYAFELVDFDTHNGIQLNNENILDRPTYEMLLRSIKYSAVRTAPIGSNFYENKTVSSSHIRFGNDEATWLLAQLKYAIAGPKLGTTGAQYSVVNPGVGTITWSTSNPNIATINSSGVLTVTGKGVLDINAHINGTSLSTRIAVGTPRFVLTEAVHKPGFYEIKASCIDTEPGYAEFIKNNKGLVTYQWGIKNEDGPIEWLDSQSSEIKLGTTEDTDNTTIYLKVRDVNGVESAPIFVRITGYDIYDLIINSWIVNNKGEIFTSTGTKLNYINSRMHILKRNATGEYANARWNPTTAIIVNDEGTQRGVLWSPYGYMKDVLPIEELERIKTYPNNSVLVYRLMLRNFDRQIFQKTPFTVIYKANFPN